MELFIDLTFFFLSSYASEATTYASEATTQASEAITHANEATTHTSEATTYASEYWDSFRPQINDFNSTTQPTL